MTEITVTPDPKTRNVSTTQTEIAAPPYVPPPPPDISGTTAERLSRLEAQLRDHLHIEDPDALVVLLGAVAAFRLGLDLVWLMVVGPSSGTKTELVTLLAEVPGYYPLSDLTENTLLSGWEGDDKTPDAKKESSLLRKLDNKIVVFKDFTTILSQKGERRNAILGQLREVYDGSISKAWGTGKEETWTGRIGLIAGVTEAIDREYKAMAQLGPRFVLFRLQQPDRRAVALRAMQNSLKGPTGDRERLVRDVAWFVTSLPALLPDAPDLILEDLLTAADLATRARSSVERDGHTRAIEHTAQPEVPARFGKQLLALARGIASVRGHSTVTSDDILATCRVALDAIPPARRKLLDIIAMAETPRTKTQLCGLVNGTSLTTCTRNVEDLKELGVVSDIGGVLSLKPCDRALLSKVLQHIKGASHQSRETAA